MRERERETVDSHPQTFELLNPLNCGFGWSVLDFSSLGQNSEFHLLV